MPGWMRLSVTSGSCSGLGRPMGICRGHLAWAHMPGRQAKYEIFVARYYKDLEDMWNASSEYLRTTHFGLDINNYLVRIT